MASSFPSSWTTQMACMLFSADLFEPRPEFEKIKAYGAWANELQKSLQEAMKRGRCPVGWIGIFVDVKGAWLIIGTKAEQKVANLRQALRMVLTGMPKELQDSIRRSLRPLDELDRNRILEWSGVESLRPAAKPRYAPAQSVEVKLTTSGCESTTFQEVPPTIDGRSIASMSVEEYCDLAGDASSDEEAEVAAPTSFKDMAIVPHGSGTLALLRPKQWDQWAKEAQTKATIMVASTGEIPEISG